MLYNNNLKLTSTSTYIPGNINIIHNVPIPDYQIGTFTPIEVKTIYEKEERMSLCQQ